MDELAAAMEVAAMSLDSDFEEDLEQPSTNGHPSQVEGATPTEEAMAEDKENHDGDAAHCQPGAADPQVTNCFPVPICTPSRPPVAMVSTLCFTQDDELHSTILQGLLKTRERETK